MLVPVMKVRRLHTLIQAHGYLCEEVSGSSVEADLMKDALATAAGMLLE